MTNCAIHKGIHTRVGGARVRTTYLVRPGNVFSGNLVVATPKHDNASAVVGQEQAVSDSPSGPSAAHSVPIKKHK